MHGRYERLPQGSKFFQFDAVFRNLAKWYNGVPPGELVPPPWGKSWIHHWYGRDMHGGGHVLWVGGHVWQERRPLQRTVRILLECILVVNCFQFEWKVSFLNQKKI